MLEAFAVTDIGRKRKVNQDYVYVSTDSLGNLPNIFAVADGMGGHNAGDYASKYTIKMLEEKIASLEKTDPEEILKDAIEYANAYIYSMSMTDEHLEGMGTTIVATTIRGSRLLAANVGDSRLYIVGKEGIRQITKDHSYVEEMVRMGGMDRMLAKAHPDKNIITRAVGALEEVEADFFYEELRPGDTVLLCSDGLTNMLEDEEIRRIMESRETLSGQADALVKAANDNGGRDNISVILVRASFA